MRLGSMVSAGTPARLSRGRTPRLFAVLLTLGLLLGACGSDEPDEAEAPATEEPDATSEETDAPTDAETSAEEEPADSETDGEGEGDAASGPPETADVVVATIPIMAMAPFFHAQDAGYFEEEGLNVEWQVGSGGAALIPRVLAGEVHFFWTALEPFLVARQEGVELDVVAQGHSYETIDGEAIGLYTLPDSGLSSIADLEGTTIGTNTLNSLGHVYTLAAAEHKGVDPDSIRWIEMGFPDMAPAMERGEIDAAWTPEPFVSVMKNNLGAVPLLDADASEPIMADLDAFHDVPGGAWAAAHDFVAANPNTVAAFERAIQRANVEIQNDHEAGVEVLLANTEMNPNALANAAWPFWPEQRTMVDRLGVRAELMTRFGMLEEAGDVSAFVHATAR